MTIKSILGFCLVIIGIGLSLLLIPFIMDGSYFTQVFLICLSIFSFGSLLFGIIFSAKSGERK